MLFYVYLGLMALLVASFLFCRLSGGKVSALFTKTLASLGFVFGAIVAINETAYTYAYGYIVLGLICGLIGDIVLDLKVMYKEDSDHYLNCGMGVFGIGHVMYFIALVMILDGLKDYTLPLCVALGVSLAFACVLVLVLGKPMKLDFGKFKYQSLAYCFVLAFMMVFSLLISIKTGKLWIMTAGFISFLVSDLILSLQYFGGQQDNKLLTAFNHIFYYAAQVLIVAQIFFMVA